MILNLRDLDNSVDRRQSDHDILLATVVKPLCRPVKSFHNGFKRIDLFTSQEVYEYESGFQDASNGEPVADNDSIEYRLGYLENLCR